MQGVPGAEPAMHRVALYIQDKQTVEQVIAPGAERRYAGMPAADGSSTRGGSTSVRGRVRSPHMAKLQAASVPIAQDSCAPRAGTDRGIAVSLDAPIISNCY